MGHETKDRLGIRLLDEPMIWGDALSPRAGRTGIRWFFCTADRCASGKGCLRLAVRRTAGDVSSQFSGTRCVMGRTAHGVRLLLLSVARMCIAAGLVGLVTCDSVRAHTTGAADLKAIAVKEPVRREKVSYSREIVELLESKCTGCHVGRRRKSG